MTLFVSMWCYNKYTHESWAQNVQSETEESSKWYTTIFLDVLTEVNILKISPKINTTGWTVLD